MNRSRHQLAALAALAIVLAGGQLGCSSVRLAQADDGNQGAVGSGQGRLIGSYADLKPDIQPGNRADMIMAGTHIPVDVSVKRTGPQFEIRLTAHDQTFETEVYRSGSSEFSLLDAAGDHYSPALDLVRFPMHVGDHWDWKGIVSSGGIQRNATATVTSSSANLYENGASEEAVRIEVAMSLYSEGTKTPAARRLSFDFVPGKGIVRREFGDASVREPLAP